jgi:hypothetical protein
MHNQKGGLNVVDGCCGTGNIVAVGVDLWLYDGWGYSRPTGHCYHRVSGPTYSGEKNIIAI